MQDGPFYFLIRNCRRADPRNDYDIQTAIEYLFMQPIALSDQPCDTMSYNAVSDFLTHRYSQPVPALMIFHNVHD